MLTVILVVSVLIVSVFIALNKLGQILMQFQDLAAKRIEKLCMNGNGIVLHNIRTWGENPQPIDPVKFSQMFNSGVTFQCTADEGDFIMVHGCPDGQVHVNIPGIGNWVTKVNLPEFYNVTTPGEFILISCYPDSRDQVITVPFRTFVQPLKGKYSLRYIWKGNDLWIAPNNKLTEILQIMEIGYREAQEKQIQAIIDRNIKKNLPF